MTDVLDDRVLEIAKELSIQKKQPFTETLYRLKLTGLKPEVLMKHYRENYNICYGGN